MDHQKIIEALEMNEGIFRHILAPDLPMDIHWRPKPGKWNLLEVACHLRDEEVFDFRSRTEHVLEYPELPMPTFNPLDWIIDHKYAEQDFLTVVTDFIRERKSSIQWLQGLKNPEWKNVYEHPKIGAMSAELFLTNWLAHDYLHIRQINRMHYHFLKEFTGINLQYAGDYGPGL
jgi:DinB superfamily